MGCIICNSSDSYPIFSVPLFPLFNLPISKNDKKEIERTYGSEKLLAPLGYLACGQCGHTSIEHLPNKGLIDLLYSSYYSYPSAILGQFNPVRDDYFVEFFFNKLVNSIDARNNRQVLEVGCYDGYVLRKLQEFGLDVEGCDPSSGADIGIAKGIPIKKRFFDAKEYAQEGREFDVILSRHFIEHVENPSELIIGFKSILKEEGLLVLETPNVTYFSDKGFMEVFSLQHINLFSDKSLNILLAQNGLQVIDVVRTPENILVIAKNTKIVIETESAVYNYREIGQKFVQIYAQNLEKIKRRLQEHRRVAIWGAGGFGVAAIELYQIPKNKIIYFVDADEKKIGNEYINYDFKIVPPSQLALDPPDIVVIASMYSDDILSKDEMNIGIPHLNLFRQIG